MPSAWTTLPVLIEIEPPPEFRTIIASPLEYIDGLTVSNPPLILAVVVKETLPVPVFFMLIPSLSDKTSPETTTVTSPSVFLISSALPALDVIALVLTVTAFAASTNTASLSWLLLMLAFEAETVPDAEIVTDASPPVVLATIPARGAFTTPVLIETAPLPFELNETP